MIKTGDEMQHCNDNQPLAGDLLFGAEAIANHLGITRRQAYGLIYSNQLPTFKIGGSVAARRSTLNAWLADLESAAAADKRAA
jgi:hypothetical protein